MVTVLAIALKRQASAPDTTAILGYPHQLARRAEFGKTHQMSAICPNCRQDLPNIGDRCAELGCTRRGYHGVPADCLSDNLDPRIGRLLADKYLLIRMLGKGGMGVVMFALQMPLMREVRSKSSTACKLTTRCARVSSGRRRR